MRDVKQIAALVAAILVLAACAGKSGTATPEQGTDRGSAAGVEQAEDTAWEAFQPNTSSRDRANWEVVEVRQVQGSEVAELFAGQPAPGCWVGPTPQPNQTIRSDATYWYVQMRARPATPPPLTGTPPATAPPRIPEAHVRQGEFLLEGADGPVVARHISCVIY